MDGNELAAEFILDTTWDGLPAEVQHKVHQTLLDALGATLAGTLTPISEITARYATRAFRGEEASILLRGVTATAAGAAFANGYTANGLDIDDGAKYTRGHPGAQLFPATLAVSERAGLSGKDMMTALVVGYEIAHRTGRCWHDHHEIYQACGSWGSVACASAVSKLMGLSKGTIKHALGIAEYNAPNLPMMRDIDHPAMVKHGIGWGAMNGVISAELAEAGFTGIPSILGFEKYQDWVSTLGSEYIMVDGVGFKAYDSCAWGHPAIVGAKKILEEHDFEVDEIEHIKVETFHESWRLSQRNRPESTEEAQFSTKWPVAAFIIDGEVGPDQVLEKRLDDEQIQALAAKIEIVEVPEIDDMYRLQFNGIDSPDARMASRVTFTLSDGRALESGLADRASRDWDDDSLEEKFRWITGYVLDDETVDQLVDMVWAFEDVSDVSELVRLVA